MANNKHDRGGKAGSGNRRRGPADNDLDERLDSLGKRLQQERTQIERAKNPGKPSDGKEISQAFRLSSEFIAAILVGAALGYAIDYWLGTAPWGMIILLMLGFCAAILNVLRAAGMVAESGVEMHNTDDHSNARSNPAPKPGPHDRNGEN